MKITMTVPILAVALAFGLATTTQAADSRVDPEVLKTLEEAGSVDIFVSFQGNARSHQDIIKNMGRRSFSSREEKATALIQDLKNNMELAQKDVMTAIHNSPAGRSKQFYQFWISNQLYVAGADQATIDLLLGVDKVSQITKEIILPIETSSTGNASGPGHEGNGGQKSLQWGVEAVSASSAWDVGAEGEGIVVGVIDTGVNVDHEALRDGFRSQNGWFDPLGRTQTPRDSNGHGTHCTGTAVGRTKGIGVAPKAMWIACLGCPDANCPTNVLLQCGEWMTCPSMGGSCTGIPDVISNSWGSPRVVEALSGMVDTWVSLGIHSVFAAGNKGPNCGTMIHPGVHPKAISVANIDENRHVNGQSSRGPFDGRIQPDVAGPGTKIYSAWNVGRSAYKLQTGTSMACPHIAGVVALLLSKNKHLSVDQVHSAIVEATLPVKIQLVQTCGTTTNEVYPNNFVGHGLVSASKLKLLRYGTSSSDSSVLYLGDTALMMSFVTCVLYFTYII